MLVVRMKETSFLHDDEYYYQIIRQNLKKIRLQQKLTQQDLADMIGMSVNPFLKCICIIN